jgi:DNA-directed RNA polymerase subunit RPC12/RpoP
MSDSTHDLLIRGIAAAKGDSKQEARFYLEWVLRSPEAEPMQLVEAWRYLAEISDDPQEKRNWLDEVLARNPTDPEARRALAILNGDLKPADIVNPDRMPAPPASMSPQPAPARRFVCPQCGGKMEFSGDGSALTCAYCGNTQSILTAMDQGALAEEQDFTIALATAQGHSIPVATQSLKCQGCGASFVLPPQTLSTVCPYCASPYVIEQTETRELIPPDGIVPFLVTQDQAQQAVLAWYRSQGFKVLAVNALPAGAYLPAWAFDIGGEITGNCSIEKNEPGETFAGSAVVDEKNMLVAASHTLSSTVADEVNEFPLDAMQPYDARYLADWPAETYQISVSDASLAARSRILAKMRPQVQADIGESFSDLQLSALRLVFESYKLVLVPLWVARFRYEKVWYSVVVNGRNGNVRGEKPRSGVGGWLSKLKGDGRSG